VTKVVLDEDSQRIEVVVPDDQLSLAIGRRGQNVRLASQLSGWTIDILTEAEESERRQEEFRQRSQMFIDCLDVDETIGQLLVAEGFATVEEVAYVPVEEIIRIEGFDEEVAEELRRRAVGYLTARDEGFEKSRLELGVTDEVAALDGLTPGMLVVLGENGVKTLDDLGDLATDELIDGTEGVLREFDLGEELANAIIMAARAHWFEDEEAEAEADAGGGDGEENESSGATEEADAGEAN
jgi:N utilization substance protein A